MEEVGSSIAIQAKILLLQAGESASHTLGTVVSTVPKVTPIGTPKLSGQFGRSEQPKLMVPLG